MSYPDFLRWEGAEQVPWEQASCLAVQALCDDVKRSDETLQPTVERATIFDARQSEQYPKWLQPFRAGQLFADVHAWHHVFQQEGVKISAKLTRWLEKGYGIFIEKDLQGKQPGLYMLTPAEREFAMAECNKWLASGAVEEISWADRHPRAKVCNLIVAYRDGRMERVCWSGVCVNEGVEDASFRMEQLKHILEIIEPVI